METHWIAAELDRIWLLGELAWRQAQAEGRRATATAAVVADLEAELAERRRMRLGTEEPTELAELRTAIQDAHARVVAARKAAPIGELARRLDFRRWEVDATVLGLAPQIDPALYELFSALRGEGPHRGIDVALMGDLFAARREQRVALLDVVNPQRPLLRWGILELARDATQLVHRALNTNLDVVGYLCGHATLPAMLGRHGVLARGEPTFDDLVLAPELRARLDALGAALPKASETPWVVLWGRRGAGKATIADRLAAHLGRAVLHYEPQLAEPSLLEDRLRIAQREALIRDAVMYIGPIVAAPPPSAGLPEITAALADFPGCVILGIETTAAPRIALTRAVEELAIPLPGEAQQLELWRRALPDAAWQPAIARSYTLAPGEIAAVARDAGAHAHGRDRAPAQGDIRAGIERMLRSELAEMAWRVEVTTTWDDIVLPPADLVRLRELIDRRRHADQVYGSWGLGRRLQYGMGMVALFSGPPGTGKSMLAGLIASVLDMDLYQVDLSQIVSKWVGETEKQLAKVFDLAERTQAVLLFDEADSLLGKRTELESSNDRFANTSVNFLLQRLERYRGIAVLTTNKVDALDEALQRRLALHLRLEVPEAADRARLWRSLLSPRIPGVDSLDLDWIAEAFELAGGHIKNAAVRAAFFTAAAGRPIDMALLVAAIEAELDDIGRVVHATTLGRHRAAPHIVTH